MKDNIFISLDIEADGPNIHKNSCIQVGLVACKKNYSHIDKLDWVVDKLVVSIQPLPGHVEDPQTMNEFWLKNKKIYKKIQEDSILPEKAVKTISSWLVKLSKQYKIQEFVAKPASYDWLWFSQLYQRFPHKYKLPFSIICISTMKDMLQYTGGNYKKIVSTAKLPPHTHNAGDDAISQAYIYLCLINYFTSFKK